MSNNTLPPTYTPNSIELGKRTDSLPEYFPPVKPKRNYSFIPFFVLLAASLTGLTSLPSLFLLPESCDLSVPGSCTYFNVLVNPMLRNETIDLLDCNVASYKDTDTGKLFICKFCQEPAPKNVSLIIREKDCIHSNCGSTKDKCYYKESDLEYFSKMQMISLGLWSLPVITVVLLGVFMYKMR